MKRYKILGVLLLIAIAILGLTWSIIAWIYNSSSLPLIEQFTLAIKLSIVGYGLAIFAIFIVALIGIIVSRRRNNRESLFGFSYFMVFSVVLIIIYLIGYYQDFVQ